MYKIHKSIDVDFAHHVRGHLGPCINLHGHTWKLEVVVSAQELDAQGFVV
ncbi:MAG: 6-pyruvoyl tetrahydropterin synthase, partial [Pseudomonadota bacterium]